MMGNIVAILVITSPLWIFGLTLWLSTVITGKSLAEQARDRQIKKIDSHLLRGEVDADMIDEAVRRRYGDGS